MRNRAVQEVSRHRAYRKQAGLGYMDLIASVLIVMVGAVSMGRLMTYSVETAGQSKARAEALALAEAKLEELRDFATDTDYIWMYYYNTAASRRITRQRPPMWPGATRMAASK